jgi:DNA-binding winged helix-turn-helix (wHTH) protein
VLDPAGYRLQRDGTDVPLTPKALDVLLCLAGRPGELVTKQALLDAVWPGVFVSENTLAQAISALREALGDPPACSQYIETVPRRGYRFKAPVEIVGPGHAEPPGERVPDRRPRALETASLEAYRAFTEGRLRLESLDVDQIRAAVADFERAIASDPRYAYAHAGLANAQFFLYEASRARPAPDAAVLEAALAHARRAVELEPDLAEAHATLSMLLVAAHRAGDAVAAARRAVALDPEHWRNHYRLGHAAWGEERLRALAAALELYPGFAYAYFELAMVHVARGELARADALLDQGVALQRAQRGGTSRFPARGLCWLFALVRLAGGRVADALALCDEELASGGGGQVYAVEFLTNAYNARGFALLQGGAPGDARSAFESALALTADHARSRLGLAEALARLGRHADAAATRRRVVEDVESLERAGRGTEAALTRALACVQEGDLPAAIEILARLVERAPPGQAGWSIPIEPLLQPLRHHHGFESILARLATRAR